MPFLRKIAGVVVGAGALTASWYAFSKRSKPIQENNKEIKENVVDNPVVSNEKTSLAVGDIEPQTKVPLVLPFSQESSQ